MSKRLAAILALAAVVVALSPFCAASDRRWTPEQANNWYSHQPWLVGSNFIPSTAINQLEMWQADSFDLPTIDRELGWAESLGMNTMRVFLHNLLWQQDSAGFLKRMDQFLAVAEKHHIRIMFVLLDSVWDPNPHLGKQRDPRPHVHNSGWMQAPGADLLKDESRWNKELKPYVIGVIAHFRKDKRVLLWDLMNEPDNDSPQYKDQELRNKAEVALQLLKQEWEWARSAQPSQPLTSGVWKRRLVRRAYQRDGALSARELRCDHISLLRSARGHEETNCLPETFSSAGDLYGIHGASLGKHVCGNSSGS